MNTEDFDKLVALMLAKGFSHVSYELDDRRVSLTLPAYGKTGAAQEGLNAGAGMPTCATAKAEHLCSPLIGTLLVAHPGSSQKALQEGDAVSKGQPVAYVRSGLMLMAVIAESAGKLDRPLVQPGSVVGYNTPVFEFFPAPDSLGQRG